MNYTESPAGGTFLNARGEFITPDLVLVNDPERGEVWQAFADRTMPFEVLHDSGLIQAEGAEEWVNVVEHTLAVTAAAVTLSEILQSRGALVETHTVVRGAWVHEANKRADVLARRTKLEEQDVRLLPEFLRLYKYTDAEIGVAMNTFRGFDRYIEHPTKRLRAIADRPIEENIVSYAHARHCGSMLLSLLEVRDRNIAAKPGREHYDFFKEHWYPYYRSVEEYFGIVSTEFEPERLNVDAVYETVRKYAD